MSDHHWFPLWVGDFVSDTAHLSDAETGQYIMLLLHMWRLGGSLPDDEVKLARVGRVGRGRKISPDVMAFFNRKNGTITQKRLTLELARANHKTEARKEAGRKGGQAKAKALENNDAPLANGVAKPYHHTTPHQKEDTDSQSITGEVLTVTAEFRESFWPMYPHKTAKPYALKCFIAARKKAPLQTILGGLKMYIETKPVDRQWCNPSTWLNQERWGDQPAPVARGRPTQSRTQAAINDYLEEIEDRERESRRGVCGEDSEFPIGKLPPTASGAGGFSEAANAVVCWSAQGAASEDGSSD